jgi:hypothetical protein
MSAKIPPQPILATTRLSTDLDNLVGSAAQADSLWKAVSLRDSDIRGISKNAGVYCFVLPESALPSQRRLVLHGRTFGSRGARRQLHVHFEYQPRKFARGEGLVVYVGKAASLRARIKGHLSVNTNATTNQVLRGIVGQPHRQVTQGALRIAREVLQKHGSVHYIEHFHHNESTANYRTVADIGECLVAERDLLEIKLIAQYAPPFNIKAER